MVGALVLLQTAGAAVRIRHRNPERCRFIVNTVESHGVNRVESQGGGLKTINKTKSCSKRKNVGMYTVFPVNFLNKKIYKYLYLYDSPH